MNRWMNILNGKLKTKTTTTTPTTFDENLISIMIECLIFKIPSMSHFRLIFNQLWYLVISINSEKSTKRCNLSSSHGYNSNKYRKLHTNANQSMMTLMILSHHLSPNQRWMDRWIDFMHIVNRRTRCTLQAVHHVFRHSSTYCNIN